MMGYLEKALNVRRNELLPASLLFCYLFLVIAFYIMGQSVGDALYLNTFPNYLPHAIIGTAVMAGVFVSVYIRLSHRLRMETLIAGSLMFFAVSFVAFWALTWTSFKWVYVLIYLFVYTSGVVGTTTGWTLANYVLTTREARRVFGFIGAGAIMGGIFGGLFTKVATKWIRSETLLLVIAGFIGICVLLVLVLFRGKGSRLREINRGPAASHESPKNFRESLAMIGSSRYLLFITALIWIGSLSSVIIGYQFKMIAKAAYGPDKAGLTAFFGSFYGYMGVASFLLQLILTGRLLRSLGIRVTLFVLPVVFLGGSLAVLLLPTLLVVGILRGSHSLLRYSLDKSSAELLYLPVPPNIKNQIKSFIDAFIWRVADGTAGVVLWLFANRLHFSPSRISLVNFVFLGIWIGIAWGVRREYLNVLRRAIERRVLDPERTAAAVLDSTTTEVMAMVLESGDEQQVLYGLSLFELGRQPSWHPVLRGLLGHHSWKVRMKVLRLLGESGDREVTAQVERMLADKSPEVRAEVLQYLVVHTGRDPIHLLGAETDLPAYGLQGSVVTYLARTGHPENFSAAKLILESMLAPEETDGARSRAEAARVLGLIPHSELHAELLKLLRDESPEVVEEALVSAGKIQGREFLPLVIERLAEPRHASAARSALLLYGERAVGTLQDYLNDESIPYLLRRKIPGVLAQIATPQAAAVLVNSLIQSDPGLRYDVLKGLNKLRRRDVTLVPARTDIEDMLLAEVMGYFRSFQILAAFDDKPGTSQRRRGRDSLLVRALRERMEHELERIFRLIGLLYPPQDIHNAYAGLMSGRTNLEANALEVLENLLRPEHYRLVAYGLDPEIALPEKMNFARRLVHTSVASKAEALRILLRSEDRWLTACALHEVGQSRLAELQEDVRQIPHNHDPLLEETWKWTSSRLAA